MSTISPRWREQHDSLCDKAHIFVSLPNIGATITSIQSANDGKSDHHEENIQ